MSTIIRMTTDNPMRNMFYVIVTIPHTMPSFARIMTVEDVLSEAYGGDFHHPATVYSREEIAEEYGEDPANWPEGVEDIIAAGGEVVEYQEEWSDEYCYCALSDFDWSEYVGDALSIMGEDHAQLVTEYDCTVDGAERAALQEALDGLDIRDHNRAGAIRKLERLLAE